jgi:hypothetical protein
MTDQHLELSEAVNEDRFVIWEQPCDLLPTSMKDLGKNILVDANLFP